MPADHSKKIGPILLSGLMIGPILGSGIIILPPMVYEVAGDWAIFAWLLMIVTGCLFAVVFGRLSILFPGDAGVAGAIEYAFGHKIKNLTCLYLMGAVVFGPAAVMLTVAQYVFPQDQVSSAVVAVPFVLLCNYMLLKKISVISIIGLIMSSVSAFVLFLGGTVTLFSHHKGYPGLTDFSVDDFGYSLLLLFWTIVGWEVVGSYSGEVKNPKQNIMRAVLFSTCVIALVSLVVSGGVQVIDLTYISGSTMQVTAIITPIFGNASPYVMSFLVFALCMTTYLLFVGGVARLMASLAAEGVLPQFFGLRNQNQAPVGAVTCLGGVHLVVLAACFLGMMNVESLVALADGFFIANAFTGLAAAGRILHERVLRIISRMLCLLFFLIFLHSHTLVIALVLFMALFSVIGKRKEKDVVAIVQDQKM